MRWKADHDNAAYVKSYNEEILVGKKPYEVIRELYALLDTETKMWLSFYSCPPWQNPDYHIALIYVEKPIDFCHRHQVADWFTNAGIPVVEWCES